MFRMTPSTRILRLVPACFPVLVQGATWYGGPQTSFCACRPGWRHQLFSNLSAAQFFQIIGPGPRHPNFSKFGGPIQFGFGHLIGPSACFDRAVVRSGVDNWRVDVVAECAVPVGDDVGAIKARMRAGAGGIAAQAASPCRQHPETVSPGILDAGLFTNCPTLPCGELAT
jgi:hypothetical protein